MGVTNTNTNAFIYYPGATGTTPSGVWESRRGRNHGGTSSRHMSPALARKALLGVAAKLGRGCCAATTTTTTTIAATAPATATTGRALSVVLCLVVLLLLHHA